MTQPMFEGFLFEERSKAHPEVLDPKTGKPLNLHDPEFPIVHDPNHKFKWTYWRMPKSVPRILLTYLEEHWDYFNKTRFHGKLKRPNIGLLKDVNAVQMKLRGRWRPGTRFLEISPNLFNAPHEGWVNRVLIHEMAHQSVSEYLGIVDQEEKGHGPHWQNEMRLAGLHPNRYDTESNETYADHKEKKVFEQRKAQHETYSKSLDALRRTRKPVTRYAAGFPVLFATTEGIILYGYILGRGKKAGTILVETREGQAVRYWTVSKGGLFHPNDSEQGVSNVL